MANVLGSGLKVNEFKLQSPCYVYFQISSGKVWPFLSLLPTAIGLIVSLLFLYMDSFGIKWLTKVDMPLNKETKLNQTTWRNSEVGVQRPKRCEYYNQDEDNSLRHVNSKNNDGPSPW